MELTPGSAASGEIPTAAGCRSGIAETVELDESSGPSTRRPAQVLDLARSAGPGRPRNGEAISDALGDLTPFAEETDDVLEVLRVQSGATRRLVRNTGDVFEALTERQGQLRELIRNSNRVWEVTAPPRRELADTFRVLPTFLREGARRPPAHRLRRGHRSAHRPVAARPPASFPPR